MQKSKSSQLMDQIGKWIKLIDDYPGWREWQRKKIGTTLAYAEDEDPDWGDVPNEFKFSEEIERQHTALMAYLSLSTCLHALQQCEFYFRRYPFSNLPVTKEDHIRNVCEMYFNRFYEFKSRLKRCLNAVNETIDGDLDVGSVLKRFANQFDQELRARNSIHHHDRFDDVAIQSIGLALLMGHDEKVGEGWRWVARARYRKSSSEWAARVQRRSKAVEQYLEAVAEAMLKHCLFLSDAKVSKVSSSELAGEATVH